MGYPYENPYEFFNDRYTYAVTDGDGAVLTVGLSNSDLVALPVTALPDMANRSVNTLHHTYGDERDIVLNLFYLAYAVAENLRAGAVYGPLTASIHSSPPNADAEIYRVARASFDVEQVSSGGFDLIYSTLASSDYISGLERVTSDGDENIPGGTLAPNSAYIFFYEESSEVTNNPLRFLRWLLELSFERMDAVDDVDKPKKIAIRRFREPASAGAFREIYEFSAILDMSTNQVVDE